MKRISADVVSNYKNVKTYKRNQFLGVFHTYFFPERKTQEIYNNAWLKTDRVKLYLGEGIQEWSK